MTNLCLPGLDVTRDLSKSQWYTPPWLAERLWKWWLLHNVQPTQNNLRVLEPSAGVGSLVRPALHSGRVARLLAIELDPRNVQLLSLFKDPQHTLRVEERDFMAPGVIGAYDVAMMNPPYEDGQDVDHILRALAWAPTAVGIFRSALVHGAERYERLWREVDIVRGKWLRNRPDFGTGDGAKSDFVALQLCRRERQREVDEDMNCSFGWW